MSKPIGSHRDRTPLLSDAIVRRAKWLAFYGDWAYEMALLVNTQFNAARRALGLSYSAWAKLKVKNAV